MSEIARIQDQLKRAFEGGAWHGPSVKEVLAGVNAAKADSRPIPGAHSIREIVPHIDAWQNGVRRAIEGEEVELSNEEDWPAQNEKTEAAWNQAINTLENGHRLLQISIGKLSNDDLARIPKGSKSTIYVLLHGVIQHHLFHAGQIAMLKK